MEDSNTRLRDEEVEACRKLLLPDAINDASLSDEEESTALEDALKRLSKKRKVTEEKTKKRRLKGVGPKQRYYDPSKFISATSNCCERLFSESKHILTPERSNMSPILFEALIFLKKNEKFWNLDLVAQAMRTQPTKEQLERDDDSFYE